MRSTEEIVEVCTDQVEAVLVIPPCNVTPSGRSNYLTRSDGNIAQGGESFELSKKVKVDTCKEGSKVGNTDDWAGRG